MSRNTVRKYLRVPQPNRVVRQPKPSPVTDAVARGETSADVLIDVPGGRLRVVWEGASVVLHGPANIVAAGRWWG